MGVETVHYLLNPDPAAVHGLLGSMILGAIISAYHLVKIILRNRRARRVMAAGLGAVLDDGGGESKNNGEENPPLNQTLMEFLRRQEADRQADRQERARQWERIEELVKLAEQHAHAAWAIVTTIQNFAQYMDQTHQHQSKEIAEVKSNQIKLSDWLRENAGRQSWPYQMPRPPMHGEN
jgi:hypothetical protein